MVYQGVRFKICDLEKIKLQIMKKKKQFDFWQKKFDKIKGS